MCGENVTAFGRLSTALGQSFFARRFLATMFNTHLPHLVMKRLREDLGDSPRTLFKKGFFNESLTPSLAVKLGRAAIIDVDSDIYISAYQALDWVFANRLAGVGTLVVYDDWYTRKLL